MDGKWINMHRSIDNIFDDIVFHARMLAWLENPSLKPLSKVDSMALEWSHKRLTELRQELKERVH